MKILPFISNMGYNDNIHNSIYTENDLYVGQNYEENVYVKSKFITENMIIKSMKEGLKASIFRIGNLTGRYTDGYFQKNIAENAFYDVLKFIIQLGTVSKELINEGLEFTPVDLVGKAILKITKTVESDGRIFHIYNHNSIKIIDFIEILKELGINMNIVEKDDFVKLIEDKYQEEMEKSVLSGLNIYLNDSGELNFKESVITSSQITQDYLENLGFKWPKIERVYVKKIIEFMKKVNYLDY
jgi:thioester reductase-like protein